MRFKSALNSARLCVATVAAFAFVSSIGDVQAQRRGWYLGPGPHQYEEHIDPVHVVNFGASIGGFVDDGPAVNSSSSFYRGGTDGFPGFYFNIFANTGIAQTGNLDVGAGGMIEAMHGSFDFTGTAGGLPTTSSGSLWQTNLLATLPITTPISRSLFFSFTPVAGIAFVNPAGSPGGPAFASRDTAGVVGFDLSLLQPLTSGTIVRYNVGYRHTGPTSFDTTLPGELYKVGGSNAVIASFSLQFWQLGIF